MAKLEIGESLANVEQFKICSGRFENQDVVCKAVKDRRQENEIEIFQQISSNNSPYILRYFSTETVSPERFIVTEKCWFDLEQCIKDDHKRMAIFKNQSKVQILNQISLGLKHLHDHNIVHRNLQLSKILMKRSHNGKGYTAQICGFGFSKKISNVNEELLNSSTGVSNHYIPKEGYTDQYVDKSLDIFSLGVCFYSVMTNGDFPYSSVENIKNEASHTMDRNQMADVDRVDQVSAYKLIKRMINHNKTKRPKIEEVLRFPLFWPAEQSLEFIKVLSDFLEKIPNKKFCKENPDAIEIKINNEMEKYQKLVTGGNWVDKMKEGNTRETKEIKKLWVNNNVNIRQAERPHEIWTLLRFIRNRMNHPVKELFEAIGEIPDGFWRFIHTRFPCLVVVPFLRLESFLKDILRFKEFFYSKLSAHKEASRKLPPIEVVPRLYQLELAEKACAGENCMIIAPTGSGKTIVALHIIKEHMKNRDKKVIFFAPKVDLVLQQKAFFERHLSTSRVDILHGRDALKNVGNVLSGENQLTVMTPMILCDELTKPNTCISISDFSLMIFDECHHAVGRRPYMFLMHEILKKKIMQGVTIPQIVGLTASPGIGNGQNDESVLDKLYQLLANLNIFNIPVRVQKYTEDLNEYQNNIREFHKEVFSESCQIVQQIENLMSTISDELEKTPYTDGLLFPGRNSFGKTSFLSTYNRLHEKVLSNSTPNSDDIKIITCIEILEILNGLLEVQKRTPNAWELAKEKLQQLNLSAVLPNLEQKLKEIEDVYQQLKQQERLENAFTRELFEILQHHNITDSDTESRTIVFVKRRDLAQKLSEFINMKFEHVNALKFTSSRLTTSDGGMSSYQQEKVIENFRTGSCKMIVATSVADEGIDVPACNLIILYDYVTNEIGRIQRKGRGRSNDSYAYLISRRDNIEKERRNHEHERTTIRVLAQLQTIDTDKIDQLQRDILRRIEVRQNKQLNKESCEGYRVYCLKNHYLTLASNLRFNPNNKTQILVRRNCDFDENTLYNEGSSSQHGYTVGQLYCRECTNKKKIGAAIHYESLLFYAPKAQLVCVKRGTQVFKNKKWSGFPFRVTLDIDQLEREENTPDNEEEFGMEENAEDDIKLEVKLEEVRQRLGSTTLSDPIDVD